LGGSGSDYGFGIAVDSHGNAYVSGYTYSTDFPTENPFQTKNKATSGGWTGFVAKLNAAGSALVYSTYLGGSADDEVDGIAVDSFGNAYVTGQTYSTNFPTKNHIQATNKAGQLGNAFVTELNADGSALVYSTYLGGSGNGSNQGDYATAIALDSSGDAYVTGVTYSTNFPTKNPVQATNKATTASRFVGTSFVTELNAGGSALVYSTYLGGSCEDQGNSIAVDSLANAYVTGWTCSTDFPTASPLQPAFAGATDTFVAKLNAGGSALVYSTYLGGTGSDYATGIAVDSTGHAYVTGWTESTNFPTMNPYQAANNASRGTLFVAELDVAGSALVYSTYLGGSYQELAQGIAVDSSGNAM